MLTDVSMMKNPKINVHLPGDCVCLFVGNGSSSMRRATCQNIINTMNLL